MIRVSSLLCLLAIVSMSLISGCLVVKTPQIETQVRSFKECLTNLSPRTMSEVLSESARVGSEGRLVEVVEQDGFFVFVSGAGDAIAFDGWNIRSIIGFGSSDTRQIAVDGQQKQFRRGRVCRLDAVTGGS